MPEGNIDYAPLWSWVREREAIRLRKARGELFPWTADSILRDYRFCCVRREDDRGTIWIRENIREPFAGHPQLWLMLCIARQINWPDTLAELIAAGAWPSSPHFAPAHITRVLNERRKRGQKVYTGAYMISAPSTKGADKQAYIAETVIGGLWRRLPEFYPLYSLRETHAAGKSDNNCNGKPATAYVHLPTYGSVDRPAPLLEQAVLCDALVRCEWDPRDHNPSATTGKMWRFEWSASRKPIVIERSPGGDLCLAAFEDTRRFLVEDVEMSARELADLDVTLDGYGRSPDHLTVNQSREGHSWKWGRRCHVKRVA